MGEAGNTWQWHGRTREVRSLFQQRDRYGIVFIIRALYFGLVQPFINAFTNGYIQTQHWLKRRLIGFMTESKDSYLS